MKTSRDVRHKRRKHVVQDLFAWGFSPQQEPKLQQSKEVVANLSVIDKEIVQAAPEWPLTQINRIDLSILRLAVFELIIKKDAPFKVVVDEAVELAKEFGSESSSAFINGVLGKVIENNKLNK
ncbi:MAG: transcription antitermination factor NusB [bacterium]|nr:transcription antitermination factor NusB [bacterium]